MKQVRTDEVQVNVIHTDLYNEDIGEGERGTCLEIPSSF